MSAGINESADENMERRCEGAMGDTEMTKAAKHVNCCSDGGGGKGSVMENDWIDDAWMGDEWMGEEMVEDQTMEDGNVMDEVMLDEAVMDEAVMDAHLEAHWEVHDEEANDMQGSEKGTQAGAFSAGEKTEVTYHTLLPRYLQDALRRAAGSYGAGTLKRQIMVNHAAAAAAREFPQRFVHEEE